MKFIVFVFLIAAAQLSRSSFFRGRQQIVHQGTTIAEINNDDLSGLKDKLPQNLQDKLPINPDDMNIDEAKKLFKEKCKKNNNGDEGAYDKAVNAKDVLENCIKSQVNITELKEEIENAKPTGDLDVVFGKYCKKSPTVVACVKTFLTTVDPCLEEKEKANKKIAMNITETLVEFLCYKDGDRIAMFIAEGGVDCLQEKQEALQLCANETIGRKLPTEMPTVDNLPLFVIEKEQCDDFSSLQRCVVAELEKCSEPTPANIIDALFKFLKKVTPCGKMESSRSPKELRSNPNGANLAVSSFVTVVATLFVRYF